MIVWYLMFSVWRENTMLKLSQVKTFVIVQSDDDDGDGGGDGDDESYNCTLFFCITWLLSCVVKLTILAT